MTTIQLAAITVIGVAVWLRSKTWQRTQSRPMTIALALFGAYMTLRLGPINSWSNYQVRDISGWNNLPQLTANMIRIVAYVFLAEHVLNALDRRDFVPTARRVAAACCAIILITYALTQSPYAEELTLDGTVGGMTLHWLSLALAALAVHTAMLVFSFRSHHGTSQERAVLMAYEFAAFMGILSALRQISEIIPATNIGLAGSWSLGYLSLLGYASASILNAHFKRNRPHPEQETIRGMGGTTTIR